MLKINKEKLIITCLFILLILPKNIVEAGTTVNDLTGGGATYNGGVCTNCKWSYSIYMGGLRLGLYHYDGNKITKVGESLDLFNICSDYSKNKCTKQSVNITINNGKQYILGTGNRFDYTSTNKPKLDLAQPVTKLSGPNIATYNYEYSGCKNGSCTGKRIEYDEEDWAKTFANNLSNHLSHNGNITDKELINELKTMFNVEKTEEIKNINNYYIAIEPTMNFFFKGGYYVYGTAYEFSVLKEELNDLTLDDAYKITSDGPISGTVTIEMYSPENLLTKNFIQSQSKTLYQRMYGGMYVEADNSKISNEKTQSYDSNNFINHGTDKDAIIHAWHNNSAITSTYIDENYNKNGFAFGISILWMGKVGNNDKEPKTCKEHCASASDKMACARQWCNANKGGSQYCIDACVSSLSAGCTPTEKSCSYNKGVSLSCDLNDTTNIPVELESKFCYDDTNTKYRIEELSGENGEISYYKIICTADMNYSLPQKNSVLMASTGVGLLNYGYKVNYAKTCHIEYKTKEKLQKQNQNWTKKYEDSQVVETLEKYKKIDQSKIESQEEINDIRKIIDELSKVKTSAENSLKEKTKPTEQEITNTLSITTLDNDKKTKEETIELEQIYCVGKEPENYCVLKNSSCPVEISVNTEEGVAQYTAIAYYALPSGTVGLDNKGNSIVCQNPNSSNFFGCKEDLLMPFEIKNAYVIGPITKTITLKEYNKTIEEATQGYNIVLNVEKFEMCGTIKLEYKCGYTGETQKECEKECENISEEVEKQNCLVEKCGCNKVCGDDVTCRINYCKECNPSPPDPPGPTCEQSCYYNYAGNDDMVLECSRNCCSAKCPLGDNLCQYDCCIKRCSIYNEGSSLYNQCLVRNQCVGEIEYGGDYYYRTINLDRPFPDRVPGANWYGKVEYITESNNDNGRQEYYDKTDGRTKTDGSVAYEYHFELTYDQIKKIKADYNSSHPDLKESTNTSNIYNIKNENESNVYCSYIIHDYFNDLGITVTSSADNIINNSSLVGSGCYRK